jgi:hypothetical protein
MVIDDAARHGVAAAAAVTHPPHLASNWLGHTTLRGCTMGGLDISTADFFGFEQQRHYLRQPKQHRHHEPRPRRLAGDQRRIATKFQI